ncbi:hypothetical protein K469DRAFT_791794, partial [Zopfia rhizophila CBS 207.26]
LRCGHCAEEHDRQELFLRFLRFRKAIFKVSLFYIKYSWRYFSLKYAKTLLHKLGSKLNLAYVIRLSFSDPVTLTSMANLASTYWNQGRWKEAEELDVQVVDTSKRVLGA